MSGNQFWLHWASHEVFRRWEPWALGLLPRRVRQQEACTGWEIGACLHLGEDGIDEDVSCLCGACGVATSEARSAAASLERTRERQPKNTTPPQAHWENMTLAKLIENLTQP